MSRHKYGAVPTEVDGIRFDSKGEAFRYRELRMAERAYAIQDLELQPRFPLHVPGFHMGNLIKVSTYVADFRFVNRVNGEVVIEDFKGVRTPMYRLKKKWVEAQYGITITEVR